VHREGPAQGAPKGPESGPQRGAQLHSRGGAQTARAGSPRPRYNGIHGGAGWLPPAAAVLVRPGPGCGTMP